MQGNSNKKQYLHLLTSLFVITATTHAQSLPAPDVSGPSGVSLPASFAPFSPPVNASEAAGDAPQIAEWTKTNRGGDTMALTGDKLGSSYLFYAGGMLSEGSSQLATPIKAAVTLPDNIGTGEFAFMWNQNASGYGKPIAINGTEAWWLGPAKVAHGETFSIFGENLAPNGECHAYIEDYGWITSSFANPYKADFIVPADLGNGTHTVWAHNGLGEEYGWGKALQVTVYDGMVWSNDPSTWYNVKDYGAKGDGVTDDLSAIESAISAANGKAGSTVYFPAGTYCVGATLKPSSLTNMRILGAGKDLTTITETAGGINDDILDVTLIDSELNGMTIEMDSASTANYYLLQIEKSDNALIKNVRLSQYPNIDVMVDDNSIMDADPSYLIRFEDCDFILDRSAIFGNSDQIFLKRCNFYGINDANTLLSIRASNGVSVEYCTAQHYDASNPNDGKGWGKGRFLYSNPRAGAQRNWYFAHNNTIDFTPRDSSDVDQNSSEDFLLERCAIEFRGNPVSSTATVVKFDNLPANGPDGSTIYYVKYTATIVGGKGYGQSREIIDFDLGAGTVTLAEPWRILPDSSSTIAIGLTAHKIVCYKNSFDGMARDQLDETAETGIEAYGGCAQLIADGNTFRDQESGLYVYSAGRDTAETGVNSPTPCFFNVYKNNMAENCYHLARIISTVPNGWTDYPSDKYDAWACNVFRNNHASNIVAAVWNYETKSTADTAMMSLNIFDKNTATAYGDDVNFFDYAGDKDSDVPPETVVYQVLVDDYVVAEEPLPPPPDGRPSPVLVGIAITGPASLDEETTAQFTCKGTYSDGSVAIVLPAWSENSANASINSSGLLSAGNVAADEPVTISASLEGLTASFTTTIQFVPPTLESLQVFGPATLEEGTSAQYSCMAYYSDGSSLGVNPSWSENRSLATISSSGLLTVGDVSRDENVTITASFGGISTTYSVKVLYVPPTVEGISIIGAASLDEGASETYSCVANYSDGTTGVVSPVWSENSSYATISGSGVLTAGDVAANQTIQITAQYDGLSASKAVTIVYIPPVVVGLEISGPTSVNEESSVSYICVAVYSDGSRTGVNPQWSENSSSASINSSGVLATGNVASDEPLTVTATYGGVSGTLGVTILYVPPTVASLSISGPARIDELTSANYTCTASYSDGTTGTVDPVWSENSPYASVNASGILQAGDVEADQNVVLQASHGGKTASYTVAIAYVPPPVVVTGLSINAPSTMLENTNTVLTCVASYSDGTTAAVQPNWTVNAAHASIDASGVLTVGNIASDGVLTVTASLSGMQDSATIDVWAVGTQVIYPLSGFEGRTVRARLWDHAAQEWHELGEMASPKELIVENVVEGQWYWLLLQEYNETTATWEAVHTSWVSM